MTKKQQKKFKIKTGDDVMVIAGRDKGLSGEVIDINTDKDQVKVKGANIYKRHVKPSQTGPGGIEEVERPIHISNVSVIDPKSGEPTRIGYKNLDDGTKVRFAKKSGEVID